jgi:hypothetical protein
MYSYQYNCLLPFACSSNALPSDTQILVIHIKRFRYDAFFASKLSNHVKFPLNELDMAPFCATDVPAPLRSKFRCIGVVQHIGSIGGTESM